MYKIMLADDEGIVIDSLKFIIEKEFGGTCLVEFGKTGRAVIELAETFVPDIAIMDIQMPGINGIEAMKEIRQYNNNVIFIVMTAYDKFDYAKEAITLGVMEYITKPMERTRIVSAIKMAMEKIDKDRNKRSNELLIKEKLETVVPIIESGFIYNMLFQEHFAEDIENYRNVLGFHKNYVAVLAVVCGDTQEGNHMTNAVGTSIKMRQNEGVIREGIKEVFSNALIGTAMANKIAVFIPFDREKQEYNMRNEMIQKAREITHRLNRKTGIVFRVGISAIKDISEVKYGYREALDALIMTTGSVAHADDFNQEEGYEDDYPVRFEKKLYNEIQNGNEENAITTIETFFEWVEDQGIKEIKDLKKWSVEKVRSVCFDINSRGRDKSIGIIETAREYIDGNYHKDISLDEVSRKVNISSYYFSKIFKDNVGEGFIEYLTKIRLEKAKELLLGTDYSIKEICTTVGYSDPNYFSRLFKKNVGQTPTEYKENGEVGC